MAVRACAKGSGWLKNLVRSLMTDRLVSKIVV
jgi:hypothetical protein